MIVTRFTLDIYLYNLQVKLSALSNIYVNFMKGGKKFNRNSYILSNIALEVAMSYEVEEIKTEISYDLRYNQSPLTLPLQVNIIHEDVIYPLGTITLATNTKLELDTALAALIIANGLFTVSIDAGVTMTLGLPGGFISQYTSMEILDAGAATTILENRLDVTQGSAGWSTNTNDISEADFNRLTNFIEITTNRTH